MEGEEILELARENLEKFVKEGEEVNLKEKDLLDYFEEKRGVFVTLRKNNRLRGCMGIPYPEKPLKEAIVRASKMCSRDPRFPNLREGELKQVELEVTVLTKPEPIEVTNLDEAQKKIEIGKHGLMMDKSGGSGLLLPQVATENNFDVEEFLNALCRKSGVLRGSWKSEEANIKRFEAEIFKE